MNQLNSLQLKLTLFASIALTVFSFFIASWSFTSALSGINPENQDKVLLHPVSQDAVDIIWPLTLLVIPVGIVLIVLASINFKLKKHAINVTLLFLCGILFLWTLLAGWAMHSEFVPENSVNNSSEQPENGKLKIRSFNLN